MGTYTPESLGIKAPAGGFQLGGWYSGRQYNGSVLGDPGVEIIGANAGKAVSNEVIAQTNPNNVNYIAAEKAKASPTTAADVNPYLANIQDTLFDSSNAPETKVPTMEQLKSELAPTNPAPTPLDRAAEFNTLRNTYGVADLETSLTAIKDQIATEQVNLNKARGIEEGKTVPLGVISGRVTEQERVAQNRINDLTRQQATVTDTLNTKYNIINTYMNFKNLDYQDAVNAYDKEFTRNMQLYDVIQGVKKEAVSEAQYNQTAAKANLQIYANAAISGNIDYNSLSADQKLMISKLEVQSGLPVGFISSIKKDPKADILFTNTNNGVTQVGFRNADGSVNVQSYGTSTGGGTASEKKQTAIADMARTLTEMGGSDYLVSPEQWKEARNVWIRAGQDGSEFDKIFASQYVDYSHPEDYGIYQ